MVNAGGRWAALPAGLAALAGVVLALCGVHSLFWLLLVCVLGLLGVAAALLITRQVYARPAGGGAPDWTLLLDRALQLDDALPTLLEAQGEFRALMEARVAGGLDPEREKQGTPARQWGALAVALILVALPLVFWRPAPDAPKDNPAQVAKQDKPKAKSGGQGGAGQNPGKGGGKGGGAKGDQKAPGQGDGGNGKGGEKGEVKNRPGQKKSDGGAGAPPKDAKPQPKSQSPKQGKGGVGDKKAPPSQPPKPNDEDIDSKLNHVKPHAGKGETHTQETSRWVYNPNGEKRDNADVSPPSVQHPGEKAVPRTKLTTHERTLLEDIYRKLYK